MSRTDNTGKEPKPRWYDQHYVGSVPPRWYVHHRYHAPMRANARDVLRNAIMDYNANGDTEIAPVNQQARNSAKWDYW